MLENTFYEYWVATVINTFVGAVLSFFVPWLNGLLNFIAFDEEHIIA